MYTPKGSIKSSHKIKESEPWYYHSTLAMIITMARSLPMTCTLGQYPRDDTSIQVNFVEALIYLDHSMCLNLQVKVECYSIATGARLFR